MKNTLLITLGFIVVTVSSSFGQVFSFKNYNTVILNDLNTSSDIEGRTYVGRNFTGTNSANLGIHMPQNTTANDRTLVVNGSIIAGNPLNLQRGSAYVAGSINGRTINYNGGGGLVGNNPLNNADITNYVNYQSSSLKSLNPDSTVTLPSSQSGPTKFNAVGGADGLAVFNVSAADIFSNNLGQQFELLTDAATQNVVINVSGTSVNWTNGNMVGNFTQDYWQNHVIWNFHQATSINFGSHQMNGAVLAPLASITSSANIDGLVVAKNLTTTGEVHLPNSNDTTIGAYDGYTAPVAVPEPGAFASFGALALVWFGRRRR